MTTLYDVLDVRPNCDAGRLKDAFRKAVKVNHPDINVDDPEAPARFRQIVRAKTILSDPELRAVYDRMLDFERQQTHQTSNRATVRDAMYIVVLAVVLASAFTLFTYIPDAPIAKLKVAGDAADKPASVVDVQAPPMSARDKAEGVESSVPNHGAAATNNAVAIDDAAPALSNAAMATIAHASAKVVDVQAPPPSDASARSNSERVEGSVPNVGAPATRITIAVERAAPAQSIEPMATANVIEASHSHRLTSSLPVKDASFYVDQGIVAYRNRDFSTAITEFNVAVRLDPSFKNAYIDRGIVFYRLREFKRAFADITKAMRIENSHEIRPHSCLKADSPASC